MLYHLLYPLAGEFGGFNVFRYITFRTAAATLTALFLSFLVGPRLITALARLRVGQPIREIGPDHQAKAGTPTMGGLLILLSLLVAVLLWSELDNRQVWIVLALTAGYGVLGFADDYRKVTQRRSDGVPGRVKLFWQFLLAFGVALRLTPLLLAGMVGVACLRRFLAGERAALQAVGVARGQALDPEAILLVHGARIRTLG